MVALFCFGVPRLNRRLLALALSLLPFWLRFGGQHFAKNIVICWLFVLDLLQDELLIL